MTRPKKSSPLVSVIITFLNEGMFLEEAIASVLAQDYKYWELLLVDDGSADSSAELALRYARQYPGRIRSLEHKGHVNRGVCASRNLGTRHARGRYFAFLDADDVWLPAKLTQQVAIMEANPSAGMVCGTTEYWYSWTGRPKDRTRNRRLPVGAPSGSLIQPPGLLKQLYPLGRGVAPCPSNFLLRRETVEQIKGFEEDFQGPNQMYEDQAFLTKVHLNAAVYVAGACWDLHRIHPASCVAQVGAESDTYHAVRQFYLKWLEEYLLTEDVDDEEIWNSYRCSLWRYQHPNLHWLLRFPVDMPKRAVKTVLPADAFRWLQEKKMKILGRHATDQ
ncbi:MAG: glycosyltransferase family A protein [Opitutales bacterium]